MKNSVYGVKTLPFIFVFSVYFVCGSAGAQDNASLANLSIDELVKLNQELPAGKVLIPSPPVLPVIPPSRHDITAARIFDPVTGTYAPRGYASWAEHDARRDAIKQRNHLMHDHFQKVLAVLDTIEKRDGSSAAAISSSSAAASEAPVSAQPVAASSTESSAAASNSARRKLSSFAKGLNSSLNQMEKKAEKLASEELQAKVSDLRERANSATTAEEKAAVKNDLKNLRIEIAEAQYGAKNVAKAEVEGANADNQNKRRRNHAGANGSNQTQLTASSAQ